MPPEPKHSAVLPILAVLIAGSVGIAAAVFRVIDDRQAMLAADAALVLAAGYFAFRRWRKRRAGEGRG